MCVFLVPSSRQLQAGCICRVGDRQTTSRYTSPELGCLEMQTIKCLAFSWFGIPSLSSVAFICFPPVWRCGERAEKQGSDLQIQRHGSEDVNWSASSGLFSPSRAGEDCRSSSRQKEQQGDGITSVASWGTAFQLSVYVVRLEIIALVFIGEKMFFNVFLFLWIIEYKIKMKVCFLKKCK